MSARSPRGGGVGSNQYQTRGTPTLPAGCDRATLAAAVADAVTTEPAPEAVISVSRGSVKGHTVSIDADGTVDYSDGSGCSACRATARDYLVMVDDFGPWVTAGLIEQSHRRTDDVKVVAKAWHQTCEKDCRRVPFAEVAAWMAAGAQSHRETERAIEDGWTLADFKAAAIRSDGWLWMQEGFTSRDASAWAQDGIRPGHGYVAVIFARENMDHTAAAAWKQRSGIDAWSIAAEYAVDFPDDPEQAGVWHRTVEPYGAVRYAGSFLRAGLKPEDVPVWMDLATTPQHYGRVAYLAEKCHGNLNDARQLIKGYGLASVGLVIDACEHSAATALAWMPSGIRSHRNLGPLVRSGATPQQVIDARRSGTASATVDCDGGKHRVNVTWKNKKATWTVDGHDHETETAAAAFGSQTPPCISLYLAASEWTSTWAVTPEAELRALTHQDPDERWRLPASGSFASLLTEPED